MKGVYNPAKPWNNVEGVPVGAIVYTTSNPDPDLYVQPLGQKFRIEDYPALAEAGFTASPYAVESIPPASSNHTRRVQRTGRFEEELVAVGIDGRYNHSSDGGATWSAYWEPPTDVQVRASQGRAFGGTIRGADVTWDPISSNYIMAIWSQSWNGDGQYTIGMGIWRTATIGGAWTLVTTMGSGAQNGVNIDVGGGIRFMWMADGSVLLCDGFSKVYGKAAGVSLATGSWGSARTTMLLNDTATGSNLFMERADTGELLIYNQSKATYRTSVDYGITWVNRTCPIVCMYVQHGPVGWFFSASSTNSRYTVDHVTYPTMTSPQGALTDEFAGRTLAAFPVPVRSSKIDPSAPSIYVLRCRFVNEISQHYLMFSTDLVNWSLEKITFPDDTLTYVTYGSEWLWASLSTLFSQLRRGPYFTVPTMPASYRGLVPFMKVK